MKRNLFLIIGIFLSFSCQEKENVTPVENQPVLTGILSTLRKDHPRLMLSASVIEEIKSKRKNDALLDKYASAVVASANSIVNKAPLARVLTGPRLLSVSRELLHRVTHLSLAFHLTSDPRFLDAAVSQMKTVCAFSDWNPSHFLDVAEMTNGVAIGYDWLYNHMKKEDAELI
ncbi:MAG: heparinase, partial [Bacteroidota bacterium]